MSALHDYLRRCENDARQEADRLARQFHPLVLNPGAGSMVDKLNYDARFISDLLRGYSVIRGH